MLSSIFASSVRKKRALARRIIFESEHFYLSLLQPRVSSYFYNWPSDVRGSYICNVNVDSRGVVINVYNRPSIVYLHGSFTSRPLFGTYAPTASRGTLRGRNLSVGVCSNGDNRRFRPEDSFSRAPRDSTKTDAMSFLISEIILR